MRIHIVLYGVSNEHATIDDVQDMFKSLQKSTAHGEMLLKSGREDGRIRITGFRTSKSHYTPLRNVPTAASATPSAQLAQH